MLKTKLLDPEILRVFGSSGHFSQIFIADGTYPFISRSGPVRRRYTSPDAGNSHDDGRA